MQKRGAKVIKSFELASEAREKTFIPIFAAKIKGKYSYVTAEPSKKRDLKESHRLTSKIFNKKITFALRNKKREKNVFGNSRRGCRGYTPRKRQR